MKEKSFVVTARNCVTKDNVFLDITGDLYYNITNAYKASYGAEDPVFYTEMLAAALTRSEIGKMMLDKTFSERG